MSQSLKRLFSGFPVTWWVKFSLTLLSLIFVFLFTVPTFLGDPETWPRVAEGPDAGRPERTIHRVAEAVLPSARVSLGLDLRGGLHIVLDVDVDASMKENITRALNRITARAADQKIVTSESKIADDLSVSITISDATKAEDLKKIVTEETPLLLFNQIQGGTTLTFSPLTSRIEERKAQVLQQAINTIRNRIDQFGVAEPSIFAQGDRRIVVQMPGLTDANRARELIGNTARLDFRLVSGKMDRTMLGKLLDEARTATGTAADDQSVPTIEKLSQWLRDNQKIPVDQTILLERTVVNEKGVTKISETTPYLVELSPKLTGDFIDTADAGMSQSSLMPQYVVNMSFNPQGAKIFGDLTTEAFKPENSPNQIAIVLDGNINSAPSVNNGPILTGRAEITLGAGGFDMTARQKEAQDLALVLRAGALPAKVAIVEDRQVGPSEGAANIRAGILSSIISAVLVILFMLVIYGLSGVVANLAMLLNGLLVLAFLAAFGATLTLPGIAGIVLTMAIAVDTNVVVNERIREELRNGAGHKAAFYRGYSESTSALFDSYVTSILVALVLLVYGNPAIKGFSVTFLVGTLTTMFSSYYVTEVMGTWLIEKTKVKRFS